MNIIETNASKTKDLVNSVYPDPVFKEWHPQQWDLEHAFSGRNGEKRLAKAKEKEDARLKAKYDKAVADKKKALDTIDEIATYPEAIARLFLSTFYWKIDWLKKCHEKFLECKEKISKYKGAISESYYVKCALTHVTYGSSLSGRTIHHHSYKLLDEDGWKKLVNDARGEFKMLEDGKYGYEHPLKSITDPKQFMTDFIEYLNAEEDDVLAIAGDAGYAEEIKKMSSNLNDILENVKTYFNGSKPTECLTDPTWGAKGEFCGILSDGTNKVSFKSFGAGGWNIQAFHFRFKVTKLKN